MINGQKKKNQNMLDVLAEMEADFILTGSRATGTNHETSDWDFFTTDSLVLSDSLRDLGFNRINSAVTSEYADASLREVLRYKKDGLQIDVQFIKPSYFEAKKRANELYKQMRPVFRSMTERRDWWDRAISFFSIQVTEQKYKGLDIPMLKGNKINAIKEVREYTGCGLVNAKNCIESFINALDNLKTLGLNQKI